MGELYFFHKLNPPSRCKTGFKPISIETLPAKADLQALAQ